jgi:hypothetical protein
MRFDDGAANPKSHAGPIQLGGKEGIEVAASLRDGPNVIPIRSKDTP